ncbi:MAG TPA: DUF4129 domain-containing protein [Puia sp.]|jgi:hypothetical protein|nr:DUF4129 domain-containing protein [Puia sp.]
MIKYLFLILFIFFIQEIETGFAQSGEDTVLKIKMNDSPEKNFPAYSLRAVSQRQANSYLKNPDYAYANNPDYWRLEEPPKPGIFSRLFGSSLFQWIIFVLFTGILLYGIYQLAKENNLRWLKRKGKQNESTTEASVLDQEIDYDELIHKYQLEGNYRLAVRNMYLRLIRTIRDKGVIEIRDSSTNAEIAHALTTQSGAGDFRYLATAYEYIFYGDFNPHQDLFNSLKNKFENFQHTLSD